MLTSFFGKSNPVNYLIIGIILFLGYVFSVMLVDSEAFTLQGLLEHIFYIVLVLFTMLLLDFVIRKNLLTRSNTYSILLFAAFCLMVPAVFKDKSIIVANIFLLLALRRILSLQTTKNVEKKILDATIWISLAALFHFWSLLFFAILFFAILRKSHTRFRHLLIPLAGVFGVTLMVVTVQLIRFDSFEWIKNLRPSIGLNFSNYNDVGILLGVSVMAALLVWALITRIIKLPSMQKKERPNAILMLFNVAVMGAIAFASFEKTGAEILFMFSPMAIIITNFLENIEEVWFKEGILWCVVLLPILIVIL